MIASLTRQRLWLAAFWGAMALTFVSAELPTEYAPALNIWDKAAHFGTFFVLASLGAFSYPARPFRVVGASLTAFGVLIELVQALPLIHRDAELLDVVADVLGIAAALIPLRLFGLPKYRRADAAGR